MPGNTSAVCLQTLRLQYDSQSTLLQICTHWTIGRDQLSRMIRLQGWPLRMDRSKRKLASIAARPTRDPTPEEIAAAKEELRQRHFAAMRKMRGPTGEQPPGGKTVSLDRIVRQAVQDANLRWY
jgi:hypothetical protein